MKAIIHGNILTMSGENYENGSILIDGGKILSIGHEIQIPTYAEIIDAMGCTVLPGFIDAHSHLGMWDESLGYEGADGNEYSDPVTPHLRAVDSIYPFDPPFKEAYKSGVTTVMTGPGSTNVIGGQFAAIKTFGECIDNMVVKAPAAMKCALGENPKKYFGKNGKAPITRMGIIGILRDSLLSACDYLEKKISAGDNPCRRPAFNVKYEALIPVLNRDIPIKIHCHRSDDILSAIRIAKEFDIKMTLDHCTEGHLIVDHIVESGLPVIIGPSFGFKSKPELRNKTFETAAVLCHAGVKTAIMTDHPVFSESDLPLFAGMAMNAGMTREEALSAITINAAEIMGIDDRVGSLDAGKDADIVIWQTDPLQIGGKTNCVMINGEVVYHI